MSYVCVTSVWCKFEPMKCDYNSIVCVGNIIHAGFSGFYFSIDMECSPMLFYNTTGNVFFWWQYLRFDLTPSSARLAFLQEATSVIHNGKLQICIQIDGRQACFSFFVLDFFNGQHP